MQTLSEIKRSTLTTKELAIYLGVSIDMIYKLVREKQVPHIRIGRRILFKKEVIDKWIDQQIQEGIE